MEHTELEDDSAATEVTAGQAFDKQWAQTVVDAAINCVAAECTAKKGEAFFHTIAVFIGGRGELLPQEPAAAKLTMNIATFRTEPFNLRQKFRESLRTEVRRTVSAPHEVDEEVRYLWQLLTAA